MVDDLFDISARDAGEEGTATIVLRVHAQPGAGRTAVVGRHGDSLKVRVAAPPQGGRANEALTRLLAETFGLRNDDILVHHFGFDPDPAYIAALGERKEELFRASLQGEGVLMQPGAREGVSETPACLGRRFC